MSEGEKVSEGEVYEHAWDPGAMLEPGIRAFVVGVGEDGCMEMGIDFSHSDMTLEDFEDLFGMTLGRPPAVDPVRRSAENRVQEWIDGERVAL